MSGFVFLVLRRWKGHVFSKWDYLFLPWDCCFAKPPYFCSAITQFLIVLYEL